MLESRFTRLSMLLVLAPFAVAACAAETSDPGAADDKSADDKNTDEKIATESAALTTGSFEWDQNLGHVTVMWPVSEGMCFLTGMSGHYQGTGENIHIEIDNGYWVLTGASQQQSVAGWATCQAWSDLGGYGYGTEEWMATSYGGNGCSWPWACGSSNYPGGPFTLWNGVNFCSLSYISGNFDGAGAWAETWWNGSTWMLEDNEDATGSYMTTGATCVGLKLSHNIAATGQYGWTEGQAPVAMLPVNEAVCALTEVQGGFRGAGEQVQISNFGGTWYLWGTSQQSGTGARAQCLYLNQR
ncbi:MAG TPA: hypothetical protein VHS09_07800 [Polyangiaceae bacterium]|nr:hypothetical protein [Polyangiaceae bacterium]